MADTPATSADIRAIHNDLYAHRLAMEAAFEKQTAAFVAAIKAGGTGTSTGTTPSAGTGTGTPAVDYFPAKAGDAPFPSPESSSIIRLGDDIQGKPYLRDKDGSIHTLVKRGTVPVGSATGYAINGVEIIKGDWDPSFQIVQLMLRSGQVYAKISVGIWTLANPGMGNNLYNASLPNAAATDASGQALPPAPIAEVTPSAIQPGSTGRVLIAPPGQITAVLATAKDGDTLALDGKYKEEIPRIDVVLKVQIKAGTVVDFTGLPVARDMGGFVPSKDFWLEALGPCTVMGAGITKTNADLTCAVRHGGACIVKITGPVTFTKNQNAIGSGGYDGHVWDVGAGVIFDGNGLGNGTTHNIYVGAGCARVSLTGVISRNCVVGHALKARVGNVVATDCQFLDPPAGTYPDNSSTIDMPEGGTLTLNNCMVTKSANAMNHVVIDMAVENTNLGNGVLIINGGTIDAQCENPLILGSGGGKATLKGVTLKGNKLVGQGATVTVTP